MNISGTLHEDLSAVFAAGERFAIQALLCRSQYYFPVYSEPVARQ